MRLDNKSKLEQEIEEMRSKVEILNKTMALKNELELRLTQLSETIATQANKIEGFKVEKVNDCLKVTSLLCEHGKLRQEIITEKVFFISIEFANHECLFNNIFSWNYQLTKDKL